MTKTKKLSPLRQLAERIDVHLKRFEADPRANALTKYQTRPYFQAGSIQCGRYVAVMYISYQGWSHLTKEDAERYLEKLDAGFVGRHYEALRQETAE